MCTTTTTDAARTIPVTQESRHTCQRPEAPCRLCQGMTPVRVVRSEELLQGDRELFIVHDGQVYRLLRTRKNKLILQK